MSILEKLDDEDWNTLTKRKPMKAVLEFDLSNPDDVTEYKLANSASDMHIALWKMSNDIREKLKYGALTDDQHTAWEEVSEMFWNHIDEYKINLDL